MLTSGVSSVAVPFDEAAFTSGILTAMAIGMPSVAEERPIFVFADTSTTTASADDEGVPYDTTLSPDVVAGVRLAGITCAVEQLDAAGQVVEMGIINPTKIKITMLDEQYRQTAGFWFVEIAGDRYFYRRTEPPVSMVTATIWVVHATAEDDT